MITMEKIDYVISLTGESYEMVRKALLDSNGDVDEAIRLLKLSRQNYVADDETMNRESYEEFYDRKAEEGFSEDENVQSLVDQIVDVIKDIWHKGNASRLVIQNKVGQTILSVSLNVSALAIVLQPVVALIGLGATAISNYSIMVYMDNGEVIDVKKRIGL